MNPASSSTIFCSSSTSANRYMLTTHEINTDKILLWLKQHATDVAHSPTRRGPWRSSPSRGPTRSPHLRETRWEGLHEDETEIRPGTDAPRVPRPDARTGFTGGHGYELFVPADRAEAVWDAIMQPAAEWPSSLRAGLPGHPAH